jgi:hypothetical protein
MLYQEKSGNPGPRRSLTTTTQKRSMHSQIKCSFSDKEASLTQLGKYLCSGVCASVCQIGIHKLGKREGEEGKKSKGGLWIQGNCSVGVCRAFWKRGSFCCIVQPWVNPRLCLKHVVFLSNFSDFLIVVVMNENLRKVVKNANGDFLKGWYVRMYTWRRLKSRNFYSHTSNRVQSESSDAKFSKSMSEQMRTYVMLSPTLYVHMWNVL